jgi:chromosome segregation ATPase
MSRDDFDIPDLGPAEPDRVVPPARQNTPRNSAPRAVAEGRSSGGWFQSLLLILLVAACSGLGYLGLTMYEQLEAEKQTVARLQGQVNELRELLNVAESSAQASGNTLQDQLVSQGKTAAEKYKHFDSEIAKLWDVAYKRNKPEIEKQAALLAEQVKQLDKAEKALAAQEKLVKAQAASIKRLETQDSVSQAELDKALKQAGAQVEEARKALRLSEAALAEEMGGLVQSDRKLTDRIAALENQQRGNALERRVAVNEEAIEAFDATRRELNSSLLQVRKKLNELQLAVEKQKAAR